MTIKEKILAHLETCGAEGATDHEISVAIGTAEPTVRGARCALLKEGLLEYTEKRRATTSGRKASRVYALIGDGPAPVEPEPAGEELFA